MSKLGIQEASNELGITKDLLKKWEQRGLIKPYKEGKKTKYPKQMVKKLKTRANEVIRRQKRKKKLKLTKLISLKLLVHREHEALSLKEVEKKTGLSTAKVSNLENKSLQTVKKKDLQKLADAYNVSLGYLISETEGIKTKGEPKIKTHGNYTREDINKMVEMYKKGRTYHDIGERYNISGQRVNQLLRSKGISRADKGTLSK